MRLPSITSTSSAQTDGQSCGQTEGRRTIAAGESTTEQSIAALWQSRLDATRLGRGD
jgi:hypothetical protein